MACVLRPGIVGAASDGDDRVDGAWRAVVIWVADVLWGCGEVLERGWRAGLPLQGSRPPRARGCRGTTGPGDDHVVDEDQEASCQPERQDADDLVQGRQGGGVVGYSAVHAPDARPEHGQEGGVVKEEHPPEVELPQVLVVHASRYLREPVEIG